GRILVCFHTRDGDLTPAPRGAAEIDHARTGTQQAVAIIHFQQLIGGAGTVAIPPRGMHIWVVQLAREPARGGVTAFPRGFHPHLEGACAARDGAFACAALAGGLSRCLCHASTISAARVPLRRPPRRLGRAASACMSDIRIPSRNPRSATRSLSAGHASAIASKIAQPASTRSARSCPTQGWAARRA